MLGDVAFAGQAVRLGMANASLLRSRARVSTIDAISERYRRLRLRRRNRHAGTRRRACAATRAPDQPGGRRGGAPDNLIRPMLSPALRTDAACGRAARRRARPRPRQRHERLVRDCRHRRFKAINDTQGHQMGDRIIRDAARALAGSVREVRPRRAVRRRGVRHRLARLVARERQADEPRGCAAPPMVINVPSEAPRVTMSFGVAEFPTYATSTLSSPQPTQRSIRRNAAARTRSRPRPSRRGPGALSERTARPTRARFAA